MFCYYCCCKSVISLLITLLQTNSQYNWFVLHWYIVIWHPQSTKILVCTHDIWSLFKLRTPVASYIARSFCSYSQQWQPSGNKDVYERRLEGQLEHQHLRKGSRKLSTIASGFYANVEDANNEVHSDKRDRNNVKIWIICSYIWSWIATYLASIVDYINTYTSSKLHLCWLKA